MKKTFHIILAGLLTTSVLFSTIAEAESVTERKNQLEYVKSQIKLNQQAIEQINQQANATQVEIEKIDRLVMDTEAEIAQIEAGLKEKQDNLMYLNYQRDVLTEKLNNAKKQFYELSFDLTKGSDYFDWINSTDSIDTINLRISQMGAVYDIYDMALNQNRSERIQSKAQEGTVVLEKNQLEKDKEMVEKKRAFIQDQLNKKSQVLVGLQDKKSAFEDDTEALEHTSVQLVDVIQKLQTSGYKGTYKPALNGKMAWPSPTSTRITSPYAVRIHPITGQKKMHGGLDIGAKQGTPVLAGESGIVITAGWVGGYGYTVIIDHGDGISTLYGHNSKLLVKVGDEVKRGEHIANVGSTGMSTGPHIHFEVRIKGKPVDPMDGWL